MNKFEKATRIYEDRGPRELIFRFLDHAAWRAKAGSKRFSWPSQIQREKHGFRPTMEWVKRPAGSEMAT